jgi:hypothetical protein
MNQAYNSYELFYAPVNRSLIFSTDEHGNPAGRYKKMHTGIELLSPSSVQFYMIAHNARTVSVSVSGKPRIFLKEDGEYWSTSMTSVTSGWHEVTFYINDNPTLNRLAPVGYAHNHPINFFEVPEPEFTYPALRDVPHGSIRILYLPKPVWVYTPPEYTHKKSYPILYVSYVNGEKENGWIWEGKLRNIMDNMIAEKACNEMIVIVANEVLPDVEKRFSTTGERSFFTKSIADWTESRHQLVHYIKKKM